MLRRMLIHENLYKNGGTEAGGNSFPQTHLKCSVNASVHLVLSAAT